MDYPQEENKRPNKTLLIGGIVLAILIVAAVIFFMVRKFSWMPGAVPALPQNAMTGKNNNAVNAPSVNSNGNIPAVKNEPLPAKNGAFYDVQPGLNRRLTAAEKVKYHFPSGADVWIRTTSPTDGSKPDVYFSQVQTKK
jgi:hypothetical protein